ncbi:type II toxin-antitoxin system HicA family toxin [Fundicoccus ignavus]|nr:type II toxin-antitoxin system HicA family toxin [Fundicoccus ignavus]
MPMTSKEAEEMLKFMGFVEVKGGKRSHRKFEKAGERPFILPNHKKDLSRIVESSLKKVLRKFEGE